MYDIIFVHPWAIHTLGERSHTVTKHKKTNIYIYMYKSFIKSRSITWDNHTIPTKQMPWRAEGRSERNIEFNFIFIFFFPSSLRYVWNCNISVFFYIYFFLWFGGWPFFLVAVVVRFTNSTLCLSVFFFYYFI